MSAYFTMESNASERVTFSELKARLIKIVNARILNGEFTERGLARILGVSQPQIHNVLKGARRLSVDLADRVLTMLELELFDLLRSDEWEAYTRRAYQGAHSVRANSERSFDMQQSTLKKPPMPEKRTGKIAAGTGI